MAGQVEAYYDDFSRNFIDDLVRGNERVEQQLIFFSKAIAPTTRSALVIGCGSGQGAHFIATQIARDAKVLAVDISTENLRLASSIFNDPRIEYRKVDVTSEEIEGRFDVIVLPDVYEHIPREARAGLHAGFERLLTEHGKIIFTVPSPGKQASLYASGKGLQVVDEIVTLEDLNQVAKDVGGTLAYFNSVSIWETNDYIHAVVERGADEVRPIGANDRVPIKGWPARSFSQRGWEFLRHQTHLFQLQQNWRRRRIHKQLSENIPGR